MHNISSEGHLHCLSILSLRYSRSSGVYLFLNEETCWWVYFLASIYIIISIMIWRVVESWLNLVLTRTVGSLEYFFWNEEPN